MDQRRLQLYERSRLRYYYAVVDCQDVRTAAHLYAECDGIEFLRSACKLDMRFVPETQVSPPSHRLGHPLTAETREFQMDWDISDTRQALVTISSVMSSRPYPLSAHHHFALVRHCYTPSMLACMPVSDAGYSCCCTACKGAVLTCTFLMRTCCCFSSDLRQLFV